MRLSLDNAQIQRPDLRGRVDASDVVRYHLTAAAEIDELDRARLWGRAHTALERADQARKQKHCRPGLGFGQSRR